MSIGGLVWGIIALVLDRSLQSSIPFGYIILSFINIYLFHRFKHFVSAQFFQTAISLILPFLFQWSLGGFVSSGAVMLWGLLALAASLSYSSAFSSLLWLFAYLTLTLISFFFDSYFSNLFNHNMGHDTSILLLTINISFVSSAIFLLILYFVQNNLKSFQKMTKIQQLLIESEKMSALGQLSANVAHEINTPLGTIKGITEINQNLRSSNVLLNIIKSSQNDSDINLALDFVKDHEFASSILQNPDEKKIKTQLLEDLKVISVKNARKTANQLMEIDIHKIPEFVNSIAIEKVDMILNFIYHLLLPYKLNRTANHAVNSASMVVSSLKSYLHNTQSQNLEVINIKDSIDIVLQIYKAKIDMGISLIIEIPGQILINGHRDKLNQVWTNLIVNACQAMNFKGELKISAIRLDNNVIVKIKDSGHGIPEEISKQIYEPFFTTRKVGEGTGIGLGIVKKIIQEHDGTIEHKSTRGVGTTFTISLPVHKE